MLNGGPLLLYVAYICLLISCIVISLLILQKEIVDRQATRVNSLDEREYEY